MTKHKVGGDFEQADWIQKGRTSKTDELFTELPNDVVEIAGCEIFKLQPFAAICRFGFRIRLPKDCTSNVSPQEFCPQFFSESSHVIAIVGLAGFS